MKPLTGGTDMTGMRHFIRIIAALALMLAGLAPLSSGRAATMLLTPTPKHPVAPGFILPDINGQPFRLEGMRGHVVVVNFWALSCPSCRGEMPTLEEMWRNLRGKGVIVLGIHPGGYAREVRVYARRLGLTFPLLMDNGNLVARTWGAHFIPTTMIIAPDGRLAYIAFGGRVWNNPEIQQAILKLRTQP